ncbi:AI-2E family transporter [Clostridium fallax]|uniref:Predicted PurR-regulated permease PerM n=1 Tax=Clostridium fallax TaxID=1533 RepID=A0A1M4W8V4_9CLOT|nr:AI-2E family transporter [Clostridium fallax]SHE77698.1 Predicted PurR-regulated permease PerM [Clostridium fallax]SQB05948.1 putative permease [Clostridium fallax]
MKLFEKVSKYLDILVLVAIGFVIIKLIDNFHVFIPLLDKTYSIISTFLYAFIIAYILNPIMNVFEKKCKLKRGLSLFITYALILGLVFIICFFFIPSIVNSIIDLTGSIPSYIKQIQEWFNNLLKNDTIKTLMDQTGILHKINVMPETVGSVAINILNGAVTGLVSTTSYVIKWVFGFIISIYVLYDKEKFLKFAKTICYMILKEKKGKSFENFVRTLHKMIGVYIGTKAIDSTIIGFLSLVGMLIIGIPYAFLLSLVVGFTNMIPYFGPFLGMVVAFSINIFINPTKAIIVLIFLFLLQQFDAWYLEPKLIGNKVGLSPFLIILGVTIGGGFYGPIGMILASPVMAIIRVYTDRKLEEFREKNTYLA